MAISTELELEEASLNDAIDNLGLTIEDMSTKKQDSEDLHSSSSQSEDEIIKQFKQDLDIKKSSSDSSTSSDSSEKLGKTIIL